MHRRPRIADISMCMDRIMGISMCGMPEKADLASRANKNKMAIVMKV